MRCGRAPAFPAAGPECVGDTAAARAPRATSRGGSACAAGGRDGDRICDMRLKGREPRAGRRPRPRARPHAAQPAARVARPGAAGVWGGGLRPRPPASAPCRAARLNLPFGWLGAKAVTADAVCEEQRPAAAEPPACVGMSRGTRRRRRPCTERPTRAVQRAQQPVDLTQAGRPVTVSSAQQKTRSACT